MSTSEQPGRWGNGIVQAALTRRSVEKADSLQGLAWVIVGDVANVLTLTSAPFFLLSASSASASPSPAAS